SIRTTIRAHQRMIERNPLI
ncbi:unnamed protein product, partial [Oikopleura dioica]